jgi:hypothetical protein
MKLEVTCLLCGGIDVKKHECAIGSTRGKILRPLCQNGHQDFCTQCTRVFNTYLGKLLARKKLRLEGE